MSIVERCARNMVLKKKTYVKTSNKNALVFFTLINSLNMKKNISYNFIIIYKNIIKVYINELFILFKLYMFNWFLLLITSHGLQSWRTITFKWQLFTNNFSCYKVCKFMYQNYI